MADQPGVDLVRLVAHENPEIVERRVAQKRRVVPAEPVIDELAVVPRRVLLDTEAQPGRQFDGHTPIGHLSHNIYYGKYCSGLNGTARSEPTRRFAMNTRS